MLRLPLSLQRRLAAMFPDVLEQQQFVIDALEEALLKEESAADAGGYDGGEYGRTDDQAQAMPEAIGGTLHLFSDGGSRGNPGQAAIGCILEDPARGVALEEKAESIGIETNNVAEYKALIAGLKMARKYQPNRLICHLDSELVVKQVNGEYKVKMPTLQPFVEEIRRLSMEFADVVFKHIPRSDNYKADALVNRALDDAGHKKAPAFNQFERRRMDF